MLFSSLKTSSKISPGPQTQSQGLELVIKVSGHFHGYGFHTYYAISTGDIQNINTTERVLTTVLEQSFIGPMLPSALNFR